MYFQQQQSAETDQKSIAVEDNEVLLFPEGLLKIVVPVVCGLLAVGLLSFCLLAGSVRKKRSLHGTYSPQKQEINAPRFELTEMMFKIPPEERLI